MIKFFGTAFLSLVFLANAKSQISHLVSVNYILHGKTLSTQQDRIADKNNEQDFSPVISYRLEYKKQSLEAYFSRFEKLYNKREVGRIQTYSNSSFGVNYGYKVLERRIFEVRSLIGANYAHRFQNDYEEYFPFRCGPYGFDDWSFGLQLGLNANLYLTKSLFLNSNFRYNIYPGQASYITQQNLTFDVGLGFAFNRKK